MSGERMGTVPETLPETLIAGGASDDAEQAAASLLRRALTEEQAAPHPAVGARMRAQIAARLFHTGAPVHRRRQPIYLGFAIAGVAALILVIVPRADTSDTCTVLRGTILALGPDGPEPLDSIAVGEEIAAGQKLRCDSEECEIGIGYGVRAILVRDTVCSIADNSRTEVHTGIASFTVDPLPQGQSFTVRANDTEVQVVGTAFSVERVNATTERVSVTEGTVRVLHGERETYVRAGERWPEDRQLARTPQEPAESDEPLAEPLLAAPEIPTAVQSPVEMIERAEALIKEGYLDDARSVYVELAARTGASGELGLYHLARLDLRQRKATESARASLAEMQRRYPNGALLVERTLTELEVWVRLGECIEARDGVASFRRDFPGSVEMLPPIEAAMTAAGCAP